MLSHLIVLLGTIMLDGWSYLRFVFLLGNTFGTFMGSFFIFIRSLAVIR
jgi:hypothetical protein